MGNTVEYKNRESEEIEIDLGQLLSLLLSRLWIILLALAFGGAAAFLCARFLVTEQFESTTEVYILSREGEKGVTYSDVQMGTQLTKDYAELIKSRYVLQQVGANLGLSYTYEEMRGAVEVTTPTDTRIIAITVTNPNPVLARNMANEIRTVAAEHITKVMDIQAVNVVDEANLPTAPASPNRMKWLMMGALLGAVLAAAVIVVRYLLDDTIKTSDDVETYLGLSTLGVIPVRTDEKSAGKRGGRLRRSAGKEAAGSVSGRGEKEATGSAFGRDGKEAGSGANRKEAGTTASVSGRSGAASDWEKDKTGTAGKPEACGQTSSAQSAVEAEQGREQNGAAQERQSGGLSKRDRRRAERKEKRAREQESGELLTDGVVEEIVIEEVEEPETAEKTEVGHAEH